MIRFNTVCTIPFIMLILGCGTDPGPIYVWDPDAKTPEVEATPSPTVEPEAEPEVTPAPSPKGCWKKPHKKHCANE